MMASLLTGMSCMTALEFADTNIVVYAVGQDSDKRTKARQILTQGVMVSSQVINETVSVLTRKQGANIAAAHEVAESLLELCEIAPVDESTIREAIRLVRRYKLLMCQHFSGHKVKPILAAFRSPLATNNY
jgi:predicted nucleic acid-binding protein